MFEQLLSYLELSEVIDVGLVLRALVTLVVGILVALILPRRLPISRLHAQHQLVIRQSSKYLILAFTAVLVLRALGVSLEILLGTAGLLTVTLGFAAQTSASNLISGVFLMAERPFVVGDSITVGEHSGEVVSIDLVSVRLRAFDNLMVRITNETMLKSSVINLSHNPIRRVDLQLSVAYDEDLAKVEAILSELADELPTALEEPKPSFLYKGFGESAIALQFSVWAERTQFFELRNTLYRSIKQRFDAGGVKFPAPRRRVQVEAPIDNAAEATDSPLPADG